MFQGLTPELQTPGHLLEKLRHDFGRVSRDTSDPYAAFDFFVTAEHLPDWISKLSLKKTEPLLKIVSHLANGAKHFRATNPQHRSVENVRIDSGAFQSDAFQSDAFDVGGLVVELKGDEAALFGPEIGVLELAERVLHYWTSYLSGSQGNSP
jgi:hypothetical protein